MSRAMQAGWRVEFANGGWSRVYKSRSGAAGDLARSGGKGKVVRVVREHLAVVQS